MDLSIFSTTILNRRLNLTQFFNQKACVLCLAQSQQSICDACRQALPRLSPAYCPSCLLPTATAEICGTCLRHPPVWDHAHAALRYTFPLDKLIQSLKYRANLPLAPVLAELLLAKLPINALPDYLIPIPLHRSRLQERGFNQAVEIGRFLSKKTGCKLLATACTRIRSTSSQTELPWKKRRQNVRNAFACTYDFSGKRVAIIDDVMTSGATINELAITLRRQGAVEIQAWVVARAFPGGTLNSEILPYTVRFDDIRHSARF